MVNGLTKDISKKIIKNCTPMTLAMSIGFWSMGGWVWYISCVDINLRNDFFDFFKEISSGLSIVIAIIFILMLVVSIEIVEWISLSFSHILEGYFPKPFIGFRTWLTKRVLRKIERKKARWNELASNSDKAKLKRSEKIEYDSLEENLAGFPLSPDFFMPFRFGNILSAAEEYPEVRYGLEITTVWPRFWFVLPDDAKKELNSARKCLDERIQILLWGLLFFFWGIWFYWAIGIGLIVVFVAYRHILSAAKVYGKLIRSAFDIHRFKLYKELHWPLPENPEMEVQNGKELKKFLYSGFAPETLFFTHHREQIDKTHSETES